MTYIAKHVIIACIVVAVVIAGVCLTFMGVFEKQVGRM